MLVKSYKKGNVEIILTQSENDLYNVMIVGNKKPNYKPDLVYEDADMIFDQWLEEQLEPDMNDCE